MKVNVLDNKANITEEITLSETVFDGKINKFLLAQYLHVYRSNQRQSNAHTKDRSEVSGGGKKPWKQKGTGRARFGSSRVPIWKGGGVAFGPRNERNYKLNISKKQKRGALSSILNSIVSENRFICMDEFLKYDIKKTKDIISLFANLSINSKKITFITFDLMQSLYKAVSNLESKKVIYSKDLNTYDLMNSDFVVFEKKSLLYLENLLSK